ncbi:hypothetical protein AcV7_009166 [Taiwanofungus camphoratus]|nr:hypothetical protein AcV7_009166 [Antrodia cinnamomea]
MRPLITICGTTGVGKSKLAIELALALSQSTNNQRHGYRGARVINADAMQVYAGMDIITNKVPVEERCGVEHLLMGFKQPGEQYIVTQWVKDAMKAIDDTHRRNQVPIVVGGTSYWIQHLVFPHRLVSFDQLADEQRSTHELPPVSGELATSLASLPPELLDLFNTLPEQSPSATRLPEMAASLYALLSALDPDVAQRWHWKDTRKVLRNLHIIRGSGRRSSEILAEQSQVTVRPRYRTLCFWLFAKPEILKPRLDARVDQMVQQGLLSEIRALKEIPSKGIPISPSSHGSGSEEEHSEADSSNTDYTLGIYQSIGYKEFHDYLNLPAHSEEAFRASVESMKVATRQYARRQVMWIRNKMLPAIRAANAISQAEEGSNVVPMYLLDTTELGTSWDSGVRDVSKRITQDFLDGNELPDPLTLSETAYEILGSVDKSIGSARRQVACPTCTTNKERPVMIEEGKAWDVHTRTRSHRRLLRKALKAALRNTTKPENKPEGKGNVSDDDTLEALFMS